MILLVLSRFGLCEGDETSVSCAIAPAVVSELSRIPIPASSIERQRKAIDLIYSILVYTLYRYYGVR